jgi:hypothetical protein
MTALFHYCAPKLLRSIEISLMVSCAVWPHQALPVKKVGAAGKLGLSRRMHHAAGGPRLLSHEVRNKLIVYKFMACIGLVQD